MCCMQSIGVMAWRLLLLLLHLPISQKVEAAVCEGRSKLFHGVCFSDSNCARICEEEGFLYGHCKGISMRCICYKNCAGGPPPSDPPNPPEPEPPSVTPPPPQCGSDKPPATPPPPPCGCHKPPATPPPPPCGCHKPPATPPPPPAGGCSRPTGYPKP